MKVSVDAKSKTVRYIFGPRDAARETVWGAAYVLTDRAHAAFEPSGAKTLLTLKPKRGASAAELKRLAALFSAELETQKVRWEIARNNLPVREFIVQQAILQAQGKAAPPPAPAADQLTPAQKDEIDRLIAEVEAELKELGPKKEAADPKGISATWEERHGKAG